jgi:hypothetical protein
MNLAISIFWYFRNRFHHDSEINLYIHVDQAYNDGTASKKSGIIFYYKEYNKGCRKRKYNKEVEGNIKERRRKYKHLLLLFSISFLKHTL